MTFVVTEPCIQCKYTDCVVVCPMGCFFEGPNFIAIHPDECIDCSMCVAECPVGAIIGDREIRAEQAHFIDINRELATSGDWQRITMRKPPLSDHEKWSKVSNKLEQLERNVEKTS